MKNPIQQFLFCLLIIGLLIYTSCQEEELPKTKPQIASFEIVSITDTSVICFTEIASDGNDEIIKKGVCWTTFNRPLISYNATNEGEGNANFSSEINGLIQTGKYYARPYVTNATGITYGEIVKFQTNEGDGKQVIDYDGNIYNTVVIGNQTWLKENSFAKHYQNGDDIYDLKSSFEVFDDIFGEENDKSIKGSSNIDYYGKMFNWDKVNDERGICPTGWHSASDDDWSKLINFLGTDPGGKLKEVGYEHWKSPNSGATDEVDFTALPGGYVNYYGTSYVGVYAFWWTTMEYDSLNAVGWYIAYNEPVIYHIFADKRFGLSVRCVKD